MGSASLQSINREKYDITELNINDIIIRVKYYESSPDAKIFEGDNYRHIHYLIVEYPGAVGDDFIKLTEGELPGSFYLDGSNYIASNFSQIDFSNWTMQFLDSYLFEMSQLFKN